MTLTVFLLDSTAGSKIMKGNQVKEARIFHKGERGIINYDNSLIE